MVSPGDASAVVAKLPLAGTLRTAFTSVDFGAAVTLTVVSFESVGSSSALSAVATFLTAVAPHGKTEASLTWKVTSFEAPGWIVPRLQLIGAVPVHPSEQLTKVELAGRGSVTVTPVAATGPVLVYFSLYSTVSPGAAAVLVAKLPLFVTFLTDFSSLDTGQRPVATGFLSVRSFSAELISV